MRAGKQRFKCKQCGILFTRNDTLQRIQNRFIWFRKWVLERQTYKTLQRDSRISKDTLQKTFYYFLNRAPLTPIIHHDNIHLRVDATYFKKFCVVCYQDDLISYTQLFRFSDAERYEEIKEDLTNLLNLGLQIASITCDGHKATLKAIKKIMPDIIVQRCLVHIQRMCLLWLTANPTYEAGKELRPLVLMIHRIETQNDKLYWIHSLLYWEIKFTDFLKERSYKPETGRYWYKHRLIRRSFFTMKRALPNMFHYLGNPNIPKTTNGIESYFGHLKNHLDLHRGLTKNHRINFIKWYIYFRNKSNM
ncbi:MAG: transposase [Ginsengibacter sp.]